MNAGHDLSLENLYFGQQLLGLLDEVSIGHALIADALYLGLHNTIRQYLNCLNPTSWKYTAFSKVYGEGRPLIILHGLFGMGDTGTTHAKFFATRAAFTL